MRWWKRRLAFMILGVSYHMAIAAIRAIGRLVYLRPIDSIVDQHQDCPEHPSPANHPPHLLRAVQHLSKLVQKIATQRSCDEISDGDGQKGVPHVESLLAGGCKPRNVVVIARRLRHFA